MTDTDLELVATFLTRIEADLARSALEAADIPAMVVADDAAGLRPSLWVSGVRLLVRRPDVARAREILDAAEPLEDQEPS